MGGQEEGSWTRAEFVRRAGSTGALLLGSGLGAARLLDPGSAWAREAVVRPAESDGDGFTVFRSRPDIRAPLVTVLRRTAKASDGYVFLAPNAGRGQRGAMIVDGRGNLVWFHRTFPRTAMNFRAALYQGKPVLTWWEGTAGRGLGQGEHVILDDTYAEVARFPAGHEHQSDLHELMLTPHGTAYVTSYETRTMDLTAYGGSSSQAVVGGIVQEIEIPSARVLFEWHSLDHVDLAESHATIASSSWDYFHVNSVDVDADGDLLVSARNTWGLYKISRSTGEVLWRLGGKRSDFAMGPGTTFAWQHDARHHGSDDRLITIFDDGAAPAVESHSRVLVLAVDQKTMRATLQQEYRHTRTILARAMGNAQVLPNGNMFVGWGTEPYVTEFGPGGAIVWDAKLPRGGENYRAFRLPWTGHPATDPRLVARSTTAGRRLYVSWNGATEVATWQLQTGARASELKPEATGPRQDFETMLTAKPGSKYAAVVALDAHGKGLGTSNVVRL